MAITAAEREDILELLVVMFNATPGPYLDDVVAVYEALGHNLPALANALGNTAIFNSLHPNFQTADEFATDLLSTFGLEGDEGARDWVVASFNAGMTKAQIMFVAWNYLEDLPDSGPAAYVTARDIMRNKAEVSEYYSVVVEGDGESIEELQDVIAGVDETDESVEAAIEEIDDELATGPALTAGVDDIEFFGNDPIRVTGVVDGDLDGSTSGSTYNPGDRIQGNTNTEVDLTVVENGDAGFVQMSDVDMVNIYAATSATEVTEDFFVGVTFNGAGWNNVGGVSLNDGINGQIVGVTNLEVAEEGSTLEVANVTGTVWASFDNNIGLSVSRWDDGDTATSISMDSEANLEAALGDNGGAFVWEVDNDDEAVVGDVTVTGGESSTFSIDLDSEESSVGDVTVTLGDEGRVLLEMHDVETSASFGNVNVMLGDSATMSLSMSADGDGATASVAGVTAVAGDGASYLSVSIDNFDTVQVGDISLTVGELDFEAADDEADLGVDIEIRDSNTSVVVGDITAVVGDSSGDDEDGEDGEIEVEFFNNEGTTTVGDITLTGGVESDVQVIFSGSFAGGNGTEELSVQDITVSAGEGAYGEVFVDDHNQVAIGDISVTSGISADVQIHTQSVLAETEDDGFISDTASNITVGNVDVSATGDNTYAAISLDNGDDVGAAGDIVALDLSATATGVDSDATIMVMNGSDYEVTEDEDIDATGNISVGNVSVEAGSETSIDDPATGEDDEASDVDATIMIENLAPNGVAGDLEVASATLTVGNGFVSGVVENDVDASLFILNAGEDGVGNTDVGDVSMTGGNFADLDAFIRQSGPSAGDMSVGLLEVDAGESAEIDVDVRNVAGGVDATVGALDVDGVDINAEQDSSAEVIIVNVVGTGEDGGNGLESGGYNVGDIDIVMGDNSSALLVAISAASYGSLDPEAEFADGDFVVGNVDIAVSATTTADLAGDGNIFVTIGKEVEGDVTTGSVTIGDITLSAFGPGSDVEGWAGIDADATMVGDVDVGTVTLNIGSGAFDDGLSAEAAFFAVGARNVGGDVGNVTVDGVTADAGASSVVTIVVGAASTGDVGVVDAGDADLTAAADANVTVSVEVEAGEDSTVDGITAGDVVAEVNGDGAVTYVIDETLDEVGPVVVGDIEADVNANGSFDFILDLEATTIGGATVGGADVTVGDGGVATVLVDLSADTATGNVVVGDLELSLDDQDADEDVPLSGAIYVDVIHSGSDDDNVTVGDVIVDVAGGTGDQIQVTVISDSSADIVIGDVVATGEGDFVITNEEPGSTGSFLYVATGGAVSIGNVDFSAYGADSDVDLDLSWVRTGAGQIMTGAGDDTIMATDGDNVITAGDGVDMIDISDTDTNVSVTDGGNDTIVTSNGDSGKTEATSDVVIGFEGATGDRLDFNLVAGSSTNYVESAATADTFAEFLLNANDALNNTGGVRYYAQVVEQEGTDSLFVAVNYGSGDVDMVIELVGVTAAQFQASYIVA